MKKAVLIALVLVIASIGANAQDYKTAAGVRFGYYNGLTIKHFTSQKAAFEGLIATRWGGFNLTGLYEIHNPAFDVRSLKWFYGVGLHVNNYSYDHGYDGYNLGVDGILGLEYTFKELPIVVSLDWKPSWNFKGYNDSWGSDDGALSVRYNFR